MAQSYATDIRPLFRDQDRQCMVPHGIRLDQADWMCDPAPVYGFNDHGNARLVHKRIATGEMPPDTHPGLRSG